MHPADVKFVLGLLLGLAILAIAAAGCQSDNPMPKWKGYELQFNDERK